MKVYLAGPMRNHPDLNFPAFHEQAKKLRNDGHTVFSPAELPEQAQDSIRLALAEDLQYLCLHAEAIALMPGWDKSRGARAEWAVAKAIGLKEMFLPILQVP